MSNSINPLDIPHVLCKVLQNLSVWNLKKCQLVCTFWKNEVNPILRKKSKLIFKTSDQFDNCNSSNLGSICQTFEIGHEINLYCDGVRKFFSKYGGIIKSLDLSFHHEYGSHWIENIFPLLVNLEELCLNGRANFLHEDTVIGDLDVFHKLKFLFIYDSSYDLDGPHARRLWSENIFHILLSAPNLERIFFAPFLESRAKTFFDLLSSEALVHNEISHLHINHLAASPLETQSLLIKQFPLKYVHLVLSDQHLCKEDLNFFLKKLQNTLKELTLTFTEGTTCSQYHPMGPLENLTKLSLIGYEGPFLISNTPKLQLFVMSLPDMQLLSENIGLNKNLKDLEIYDSKAKYELMNLNILFQHFSNLRSLKMNNVDNDILRLVFANLPTLNELCICFHKFYGISSVHIDSGLSGISDHHQEEHLFDCFDDREIDHIRNFPWIGDMRYLRSLELELGQLGDFGVALGIARCCSIRRLILKNSIGVAILDRPNIGKQPIAMTDRSIETIANQMDLHYLKIEGYTDFFSKEALQNVLIKMQGREVLFI